MYDCGIINFNLFYDDDICQWGISTVVLWPSTFIIFLELNKFFKSPKWQILGGISFEMYLWHMSVILSISSFSELISKIIYIGSFSNTSFFRISDCYFLFYI